MVFISTCLFVYDVDGISLQESSQIFDSDIHDPLSRCLGCPGNMRGDDAVLSLEQRVVTFDRLCRNNIQTCSIYLSAVQCISQILFNDKLTAAVVDQDDAVFHLGDTVFVDHAFCAREERAVQEDHVRTCIQFIKLNIFRQFFTAFIRCSDRKSTR